MTTLPAAQQPVLDPAQFPRVRGRDQSSKLRFEFTQAYPNGLPIAYQMETQGEDSSDLASNYVEEGMDMSFYTVPPRYAPAIFSTINSTEPFRTMEHILPHRKIHLWTADEITLVCNSIRKVHWETMKTIRQPFSWTCLYAYFDSADLYYYGSLNLWNVINQLWHETKYIEADKQLEFAIVIGHWADEWTANDSNRTKLLNWNESHGPILFLLDNKTDIGEIGDIQDDALPTLCKALKTRRGVLLQHKDALAKNPECKDLMTVVRAYEAENWMGKFL